MYLVGAFSISPCFAEFFQQGSIRKPGTVQEDKQGGRVEGGMELGAAARRETTVRKGWPGSRLGLKQEA